MRRLGAVCAVVAFALAIVPSNRAAGDDIVAPFEVGTARVSIAPEYPIPLLDTIFVGGVIPGPLRPSQGNAEPTYARAVAISTPDDEGFVLAEVDIQGIFAGVKQGPYGLQDAAELAAAETGLDPAQIVVGSSHTHAGADVMGLWGGAPSWYMEDVRDAIVDAVAAAWNARRPAELSWTATNAPELLQNQSDFQGMDDELRMLIARDPDTADPIALLPNWQGHPSLVPGTHLHPDWVGDLDDDLEAAYPGAFAMSFIGAVGHTQTGRQGNSDEAVGYAASEQYAADLKLRLDGAMDTETAVAPGPVQVAQVFLREPVVNPLTLALNQMPDRTSTLYRADSAPWLGQAAGDDLGVRQARNVVGTRVWAVRIGDVLLATAPGEAYPWIHWQVRDFAGASKLFFLGLAGDTLGYLVGPSEDIPKFATDINDNLWVHISPTVGDHVMCSLVTAAETVGFDEGERPARCAAFGSDQVTFGG